MKLELRHLAAYLPYELKCYFGSWVSTLKTIDSDAEVVLDMSNCMFFVHGVTPILRPLSDLNVHYFKSPVSDFIVKTIADNIRDGEINLATYFELLKNHFDVFGLIEAGLAIDINTLNNPILKT